MNSANETNFEKKNYIDMDNQCIVSRSGNVEYEYQRNLNKNKI